MDNTDLKVNKAPKEKKANSTASTILKKNSFSMTDKVIDWQTRTNLYAVIQETNEKGEKRDIVYECVGVARTINKNFDALVLHGFNGINLASEIKGFSHLLGEAAYQNMMQRMMQAEMKKQQGKTQIVNPDMQVIN